MGRRRGLGSALNQLAKASARAQRQAHRAALRQEAAAARAARIQEREFKAAAKAAEKEAKAAYLESREREVEELNEQLEQEVADLAETLGATLSIDDTISFDSLRVQNAPPTFEPAAGLARAAPRPIEEEYTGKVKAPGFLSWLPWVARSRDAQLKSAREAYAEAVAGWEAKERQRLDQLHAAQIAHQSQLRSYADEVAKRNAEVDRFQEQYRAGRADAVEAYNTLVLERSDYPDALERDFEVTYSADAAELSIEFELPRKSCIPLVGEYKYVKAKDSFEEKPRKAAQIRSLYQAVIAGMCLRSIHEVLEADKLKHLRSVVFNGYVADVNPATGQDGEHCLVSLRARRDAFDALNLRRVDKIACIESLGGQISSRPDELETVPAVAPYGTEDGAVESMAESRARQGTPKVRARSS